MNAVQRPGTPRLLVLLVLLSTAASVGRGGEAAARPAAEIAVETEAILEAEHEEPAGDAAEGDRDANGDEAGGEAAAPGRYRLTLEQAERLALQYSHTLRAVRQKRGIAEGRIMSAWGEALPSVSGRYTKTIMDTYEQKQLGKERDQWANQYTGVLSVRQPLFKGGQIGAGLRAARLYRRQTAEEIRQERQSVLYDVRTLYYGILLNAELVEVAREQVALAEKYLDDVRQRLEIETATPYDVLRAEVALTNDQTDLTDAQNQLRKAKSAFLRLLGLPMSADLELLDELVFREKPSPRQEALYRRAVRERPEVRLSDLLIGIQDENVRALRGGLLPQVFLTGEYSRTTTKFDQSIDEWEKDWQVSLTVDWLLFDALLVRGQIKEERARKQQFVHQNADLRDAVRLQVRNSVLDIRSARQTVRSQQRNVEQAEESLRLTRVREAEGLATYLDVLTSRTELAVAQRNYYRSLYEYFVSWTDLALAVGVLGEEDGVRPPLPVAPSSAPAETAAPAPAGRE
jgi:outer membrane protein TolC